MAEKKPKRRRRYVVRTIHASGLYSSSLMFLTRMVAWLMALPGVSLISGTEAESRPDSFLRSKSWTFVHGVKGTPESRQLWLAWRKKRWQLKEPASAVLLSTMTYFPKDSTKPKGSHHALRVLLRDLQSGRLFIVYVVHMSLDNTPQRALVWLDECKGLARLLDEDAQLFPGCVQIVEGDVNKNWRDMGDRIMCQENLARPSGLTCAWEGHLPIKGGTHGPRSILDHLYVRGEGVRVRRAVLLPVTGLMRKTSDHFPFKVKLRYR